ncbi:MAG: efflux RND transporter periplasmic adaptor subunit [Burkholderiales bacterium]|nr:efflux RND transporter periplasmic adaptor subunit [Burkholderiales bacterium]
MKKLGLIVLIAIIAVAAVIGYEWFIRPVWFADAKDGATSPAQDLSTTESEAPASGEKKPLYWHDPMFPQQKFDKPGPSPFMDMQLVPVYEEGADAEGTVSISPRIIQNLGIRTALVESGAFSQEVDVVGSVQANERQIEVVQSRASGWVERLHVRAVSDSVKRGQLLAEVYAPDLLVAQEEYLLALNIAQGGNDVLARASRARLSLLGLNDAQIRKLENTREPQRRVAFYSPLNGIVAELGVREGTEVKPGMAMFNLVDLSTVWVIAEIPESQAGSIGADSSAEITLPAFPGRVFKGRVDYIYPRLDKATRTLEARIVLKNPNLKLKPGMYADITLYGEKTADTLTVPTEAVIKTGRRSVVILATGEGKFKPVEVKTGMEAGGKTQIVDGLEKGQKVVASGQFLIDSTSSLRTALDRLAEPEAAASGTPDGQTGKGMAGGEAMEGMKGSDPTKGMMDRSSMKGMPESGSMKGMTGGDSKKGMKNGDPMQGMKP